MLSIFIMLIIAIGLCAGIGYGILTLIKSGEVSLGIQKNQARLENITAAIRANLRYENGGVLIPVDMETAGAGALATVPDFAPFNRTAYGRPITYCPVASADFPAGEGEPTTMIEDGLPTYEVTTVPIDGRNYVTSGRPSSTLTPPADIFPVLRAKNVVAYLLSPDPNTDTVLRCADVEFAPDGGAENLTILIQGGSVAPVLAVDLDAIGQEFAISASGALPAGAPATAKPFRSVADAADYIGRYGILDATVTFHDPDGTGPQKSVEAVPLAALRELAAASRGRTLRIKSMAQDGTVLRVVDSTAVLPQKLSFEGTAFISGVEFAGTPDESSVARTFDVTVAAGASGRVFLDDVLAGGLATDGGDLTLAGEGSYIEPKAGSGQTVVSVNGGRISVRPSSSLPTLVAESASVAFDVNGGVLSLNGQPRIEIGSSTALLSISGNGSLEGVGGEPGFEVVRDGGDPEDVFPNAGIPAIATCGAGALGCEAACPAGKTVVSGSGSCATPDGIALSGFGNGSGDSSYICTWTSPVTTSATAAAVCR